MGKKRVANTDFQTSGSGAKEMPTGDHGGVGKHKQEGATRVGTCPADASKHDPNFGHKIKD
jgi:hypothetical protein